MSVMRPAAVGASALGPPVVLGAFHRGVGMALGVIEVTTFLVITCTAVYGSAAVSERAFRLLRWIANRPEPPAPPPPPSAGQGSSRPHAQARRTAP